MLPLNAAIALSILFLGPEIVRSWRGETSFTIRHPWVVAFAFGLLHGFGFASALTSAGLPKAELPIALLSFNVGVEIGQLSFVALILSLERAFRILEVRWPRWAEALPGYTVGSLGAFWTVQRVVAALRRYAMNSPRQNPVPVPGRSSAGCVLLFAVCADCLSLTRRKAKRLDFSLALAIRSLGSTMCSRWLRSVCGAPNWAPRSLGSAGRVSHGHGFRRNAWA